MLQNTMDNDESYYSEDEAGILVKRKRDRKKIRMKTVAEMKEELDADLLMNLDALTGDQEAADLEELILHAEQEENSRYDQNDFQD